MDIIVITLVMSDTMEMKSVNFFFLVSKFGCYWFFVHTALSDLSITL